MPHGSLTYLCYELCIMSYVVCVVYYVFCTVHCVLKNLGLEAPGPEIVTLSKEVNRKMVGFQGVARIEKSRPGGARARNSDFE